MDISPDLYWLPRPPDDWRARLRKLTEVAPDENAWQEALALSRFRLDFVSTNALGAVIAKLFAQPPGFLQTRPQRLAVLSSATMEHVYAAIRVGALRRGMWLDIYGGAYGQYRQALIAEPASLAAFAPTVVLLALDAHHVTQGLRSPQIDVGRAIDDVADTLAGLWCTARERFGCDVYQQTILPVFPPLLGNNEHRYAASAATFVAALNTRLRGLADTGGIDLIAIDTRAQQDGLHAWHNAALWHKSKQEISLNATPMYGDMVARVVASKQGLSAKCCVLDLDDTLWGGVVGDDGEDNLVIGAGTALGEAFAAVQAYALDLRRRGIILAVCSKNDEAVARRAFTVNAEMKLKEADFACFVANWNDKATNLKAIAERLNIGLDALVFVDDNPAERAWVRRQLPMVFVPELPPDPASYPRCLADAGCFEAVAVTREDCTRAEQYGAVRRAREAAGTSATGLEAYLADLEMKLIWGPVGASLTRATQLINKTNQFNLTTRRYSEHEVRALAVDPNVLALQLRLVDKFGDNGIIAIVIGRMDEERVMEIDTWLMSCRVLGRQVERATLNLVADEAGRRGACKLRGVYRPTRKNAMVREHYQQLGFALAFASEELSVSVLDLSRFSPFQTPIAVWGA